jgi:cytoskeleton protein RodZ
MGGFGERLRREREKRGVSLEEIAGSTKIGTRSLRALEEDAFESLPGGIFNRGFVRAYARTLGLDEEQYLSDFNAAYGEYLAANGPPPVEAEHETEKQPEARFAFWPVVAVSAFAVILGSGWFAWKTLQARDTADSGNAQVASAARSERELPPAPSQETQSASIPVKENHLTTGDSQHGALPQPSERSKPQELSSPTQVATSRTDHPAPIRIELFAREESWISVLADGKSLGQGMLTAQKRKSIAAQKEVRVTLGNVAGVEVSFNGRDINIDGQPKQVKELTFTVDGLQQ